MTDEYGYSEDYEASMDDLSSAFGELSKASRELIEGLSVLSKGVEDFAVRATGAPIGSWDRLSTQVTDSIHGIGKALIKGDIGDMGRKFIRNLAGKLGDDVSRALGDALGGGFFAKFFGNIVGEFVRGIQGLFGKKEKHMLDPVKLGKAFEPPAMIAMPVSLLPSSAALGGRAGFANVSVTVNGVVGSPRDVADEIERIVTRSLEDLNRRGA